MKAVIFDLDGIITDTAKYHYIAWKNMAQKIGIEIDEVFNEKLKGISRMGSLELILEQGGKTGVFNATEKDQLATDKNAEYLELLKELSAADILPGIKTLLEQLRAANYGVALASASKNAPQILAALGIEEHFPVIADPAAVKAGKPAPDIFLAAAAQLGAEPTNCIGIEDAEAGVRAIRAAGMKSIAVGTDEAIINSGADIIVAKTELVTIELVEQLFGKQ
ncbi:MAG: beta-phosphoglucomutase [Bacillota bacterium]